MQTQKLMHVYKKVFEGPNQEFISNLAANLHKFALYDNSRFESEIKHLNEITLSRA